MITEKKISAGKPIVWMASGGDYAITLASLADGAGRCGVVGDLARHAAGLGAGGGKRWKRKYAVELQINMDVAPVAGTVVELWWSPSDDGESFQGGATGANAAYTGTTGGTVAQSKVQMMLVGALPLTPDADTVVQRMVFVFRPPTRYGCPVVINLGGQALEGDDNSHRITFTPLIEEDT